MEKKNFGLPACVEMKLSQSDIIDYVINKEIEKIKPDLIKVSEAIEAHKKENTPINICIEYAKNEFKSFFGQMGVTKVIGLGVGNRSDETFDIMRQFMDMRGYNDLWESAGRNTDYTKETLFLATDKVVIKFTLPDSVKEVINNYQIVLKSLNNERDRLENQIRSIREGSHKVKNNLVQQILSSSEDGKKLLDQLNAIDLTETSKLLE